MKKSLKIFLTENLLFSHGNLSKKNLSGYKKVYFLDVRFHGVIRQIRQTNIGDGEK